MFVQNFKILGAVVLDEEKFTHTHTHKHTHTHTHTHIVTEKMKTLYSYTLLRER